jgi:hypothetical protein
LTVLPPNRSIALFFTVFLAGCAVPMGPGFQHSTRKDAISEVVGGPPITSGEPSDHIHMQVTDVIENVGNGAIAYLDVGLKRGPAFRVANLTLHVDGRQIESARMARDPAAPTRVQFAIPWKPNESRTIVFDYDVAPSPGSDAAVGASADGFYIADSGAFPAWRPPVGVFVKADVRSRAESLEFALPAGFRVLASGQEVRSKQNSAGMHQFRLVPTDFPPFAIAGRYQESIVTAHLGRVIFWTLEPLDPQPAQAAAERLAGTVAVYDRLFGPVAGGVSRRSTAWPVYIAEASTMLPHMDTPIALGQPETAAGLSALSFPQGALLDRRAFALGVASEPVLELAEYELAQTWFGWRVQVRPEAETLIRDGLAMFAVAEAAGAREGDAGRRRYISLLVAAFDRARANIAAAALPAGIGEKATIVPPLPRIPEERAVAACKAALFFVAFEDIAGQQSLESAMHRLLRNMAGESIDDADLRSALEAASGRDLAAMFRTWRSFSEIPPDFRAKYRPTP